MDKKIGHYSFIGGVILAIVVAVLAPLGIIPESANAWLFSLLVLLGAVVGFMNIASKQKKDFMLVCTVLIIAAFAGGASTILGNVALVGEYLRGSFVNLLAFLIPAVIVVGLRSVWEMGQNQ